MTTPDEAGRAVVHDVIFDELCAGIVRDESRAAFLDLIAKAKDEGCDAVILGCTEISLLVEASDASVPLFDTTRLHALAAADWALAPSITSHRPQ